MAITPQAFQHLLGSTILMPKERNEAWRLYKQVCPDEALAFVHHLKQKTEALRQSCLLRSTPIPYQTWGAACIEQDAIHQMNHAMRLPIAVAGALMPDAHMGYGLPIGGVLAVENAVIPYAVGVDIACRMMLSVYPESPEALRDFHSTRHQAFQEVLLANTVFGSGPMGQHEGKIEHPVLEEKHWQGTKLTRGLRQTGIRQIGTSGGGNHFVEWGELEIGSSENPLGLQVGKYVALLSHSGSRGVGAKIADHYTKWAMEQMPTLEQSVRHLAWLPLDSEAGLEYWDAMQLAGKFASANHHVIHQRISQALGLTPLTSVENHHNFAWKESVIIDGIEKEWIVHRKGATPAGKDVLGIIPGTMADVGFLVRGKGHAAALNSASHGSGRQMSRTRAKQNITSEQHAAYLSQRGVKLIGGGLDEAPQAYKPIEQVIEAQSDLVEVLGVFQPRIVRMASD
ncbi:protein rtcB [Parachlamydia acanthamoebae UV-7]|uniref:3'-phosphate/5'-hydroxy nucleic acid ligase n=3 Tax=Parachlamydia acanthamoebae TaxID=83552 RepID=F8KVU9_PARAV|nr:RtcB family protein [Parachlamydia acanthamoebae]EFB42141.1 hypothetical protein pah_c014o052 [Parachlamydia acanthamoebae str. Hall's coccus]CCB85239.1 protein rtcB [Parachlamydia acanthamoebae UV-7]